MSSKKITLTKNYVDNLKSELASYKEELEEARRDRQKFREYFIHTLKTTLKLLGENKSISSEWFAKDLASFLNSVESWYWGS